MRPLAHQMIETLLQQGEDVRIVVFVRDNQNLPVYYVKNQNPITLLLPASRPLNIFYEETQFSVDLCFFDGPPQRCVFEWRDVIAVGKAKSSNIQATVVIVVGVVLEDGVSLQLHNPFEIEEAVKNSQKKINNFLKMVK